MDNYIEWLKEALDQAEKAGTYLPELEKELKNLRQFNILAYRIEKLKQNSKTPSHNHENDAHTHDDNNARSLRDYESSITRGNDTTTFTNY